MRSREKKLGASKWSGYLAAALRPLRCFATFAVKRTAKVAKANAGFTLDPFAENRYSFLMAKRPVRDDDDDDDLPKVRKRRYKPPKKEDDDDDAPMPGRRGGVPGDDEDEDDEDSISTGNVYLDIALDFIDDCIDWSRKHVLYAVLIASIVLLLLSTLCYFAVNSVLHYLNRPSLERVIEAYDRGLFPETKLLADHALTYISTRNRPHHRTPFLFLQGAALCAIAEREPPANRRDFYLMAANILKESAVYDFLPSRAPEGWFLLGKSLFHIGELEQCRDPLRIALAEGYPHTKEAYWYLANAYFLGASPDLPRARHYLQLYQNEPTALEEEIAESGLLETMITLKLDGIEEAEKVLATVPRFRQFELVRNFVEGQIELFKARREMRNAVSFENDPNPSLLQRAPAAPVPVVPVPVAPQPVIPELPIIDTPAAPAPVSPMDEAMLQEFMRPDIPPVPVLGGFDSTSPIQQRMAEMRPRYADDMAVGNIVDDDIIILPREGAAPVPPPMPERFEFDHLGDDPIMRRIQEYRNAATSHYHEAIARFSEVVRMADIHNPWGRTARLLLGMCYLEMGNPREAGNHFRSLMGAFPDSSEAAVAGFLLGEHDRMMGNTDAAFRAFAQTYENLRRNPAYASLWLPKEAIVKRSADMVRDDIDKHFHADAVRLLHRLHGVMPETDRMRLIGEARESWAALLQRQAETTFGEQGEELVRESEWQHRHAGATFAALAQLVSDTQEFSELLWRGAENYRLGKDHRRAIMEYLKYIRANYVGRRPEVNLRLGELYLHLDILGEAAFVLEEGLREHPAHYLVPQMRLILSYVYREQREWEKAKTLLQLNLIGEAAPASVPYRDAMFELGKISFEQGDLDSAIPYLEDAIQVHPNAVQAAEANYTLGLAYIRQAERLLNELAPDAPEAVRRSVEANARTHRHRALRYFEHAEIILTDRLQAMGLIPAERLMLRNAHFKICTTLLLMEQYEEATLRLNTAAAMYQDSEEALYALVQMAFALRMIGRDTESQTALRRAEVILNQLEQLGIVVDGADWRNVIQGQMRR